MSTCMAVVKLAESKSKIPEVIPERSDEIIQKEMLSDCSSTV